MEHVRLKRRMVAILLADVVGYSRLMELDEEQTHVRLSAIFEEIEALTGAYDGRIVRTLGDGSLIEFNSASDAVHCGLRILEKLAAREGPLNPAQRINLRIGINLGDVITAAEDIYGNNVNVAARLETLAEPGTVYISSTVYEQVRTDPGLTFVDRGEHLVKNISHPVHVFQAQPLLQKQEIVSSLRTRIAEIYKSMTKVGRRRPTRLAAVGAVMVGTVGIWSYLHLRPKPSIADSASILVLPFENPTKDPAQEYLVDAVTSDVSIDLSRMQDIVVISTATALTYKGKQQDLKQISSEVGVRYLLKGSVARVSEQVKTTVQLIEAHSGLQLWADRFETPFAEVEKLEEAITGRIATSLGVHLVQAEGRRAERAAVPDALELRMRATGIFLRAVIPETAMTARQLLQKSIALDPNSAEAWARLAQITASDYLLRWNNTGSEQLADAEKAVQKALQLDPNLALAYAQKADELIYLGQPEDVRSVIEHAIRLSPRDPSLGIFCWFAGKAEFYMGNYDQAIRWLQQSLAIRRNVWFNCMYLASAHALVGQVDDARTTLNECKSRFGESASTLARVKSLEGANPGNNRMVTEGRESFHRGLTIAGLPES